MNSYIKTLTDDINRFYIEDGISDVDELLDKIRQELYEIKSEKDKMSLLSTILECNALELKKHLTSCKNKGNCTDEKKHDKVNYFLQQELEELGVLATDNFNYEEKESCNDKLDEILQTIILSNKLVDETIETLRTEIEELKTLYVLGKKNWGKQLIGTITSMTVSGVISEATAKPIIENVLKPSGELLIEILKRQANH